MKIIFQLLVYNLMCFVALAQVNVTVNTPKGESVDALDYLYLYNGDYDSIEWEYQDNFWLSSYGVDASEVTILAHSSIGYNCHSYAWHVSEGGDTVWINDLDANLNDIDNVNKYWDDGSYVETAEANHRKVFYHPETEFDHSAVTTAQSGWFISKWTNGPLVRHEYDNCPYWDSEVDLTYYKLNPTISGSSGALCDNSQRTFVSEISDENFTYNWSSSSTYLTEISEDDDSYTVEGTSAIGEGNINLSITTPSGATANALKIVGVNRPAYGDVSLELKTTGGTPVSYMCPNTHYHIFLMNDDGSCSLSNYSWSIPAGWTTNYTYNNMISVYTNSSPGGMVEAYANTCCSVNTKIVTDYFASGYCGGMYSVIISPNPTTGETTLAIETTSEDIEFDENTNWELEVFDQVQMLKTKKTKLKGKTYKINTSGWKEGIYFVQVKYKDEVLDGKLVVK